MKFQDSKKRTHSDDDDMGNTIIYVVGLHDINWVWAFKKELINTIVTKFYDKLAYYLPQ